MLKASSSIYTALGRIAAGVVFDPVKHGISDSEADVLVLRGFAEKAQADEQPPAAPLAAADAKAAKAAETAAAKAAAKEAAEAQAKAAADAKKANAG